MFRAFSLSLLLNCLVAFAGAASAACTIPGVRPSASFVETFNNYPNALLARYPNAEPGLTSEVRSLAAVNANTLSSIIGLARGGDRRQRQAIGLGLGRVAAYCLSRDPDLVRRIADGVRNLGNREVANAYRTALEERDFSPAPLETLSPPTGAEVVGPSLRSGESGSLSPPREAPVGTGRLGGHVGIGTTLDGRDLTLPDPFARSDPFRTN